MADSLMVEIASYRIHLHLGILFYRENSKILFTIDLDHASEIKTEER